MDVSKLSGKAKQKCCPKRLFSTVKHIKKTIILLLKGTNISL